MHHFELHTVHCFPTLRCDCLFIVASLDSHTGFTNTYSERTLCDSNSDSIVFLIASVIVFCDSNFGTDQLHERIHFTIIFSLDCACICTGTTLIYIYIYIERECLNVTKFSKQASTVWGSIAQFKERCPQLGRLSWATAHIFFGLP